MARSYDEASRRKRFEQDMFAFNKRKVIFVRKNSSNKTTKYCKFHKTKSHDTKECRAMKRMFCVNYKKVRDKAAEEERIKKSQNYSFYTTSSIFMPSVFINFCIIQIKSLLDTGSEYNILSKNIYDDTKNLSPCNIKLYAANKTPIKLLGLATNLTFLINSQRF